MAEMADTKRWAKCECGLHMEPFSACRALEIGNDKEMRDRIPYDGSIGEKCPDCNARAGKMHHLGCDQSRCPFCGGQESFCDCDLDQIAVLERVE